MRPLLCIAIACVVWLAGLPALAHHSGAAEFDSTKKIDLTGVAVSFDGIELQDREFFAAIKEKREPNASFAQILPAMQTLDKLDKDMGGSPRA